MSNTLRLSIFSLIVIFSSGTLKPFSLTFTQAMAACLLEGEKPAPQGDVITTTDSSEEEPEPPSGNRPESGDTVICADGNDAQGVYSLDADNVTVQIQGPEGGIEVAGELPGIVLANGAKITVEGPNRPITTAGDSAPAIVVQDGATITINGIVSTAGENSAGITTGSNAKITIREGTVSTSGAASTASATGSTSAIDLIGTAQVSTSSANATAILLAGENSNLDVGATASVTTAGSGANPVRVEAANGEVTVSGAVSSAAQSASAVLSNAENTVVNVAAGGVVSTQGAAANAIEIRSTGAKITVSAGGEVSVFASDAAAVVSGRNATVNVAGKVSAAAADSQGVVVGDGSSLSVQGGGAVTTSSSGAQAVVVEETASSATITIESGGQIAAAGAAVVDNGATNTTLEIGGQVSGGGSGSVIALGAGSDTVTVNGSVTSNSESPVIDLGEGDDILNDNSSQPISGPGQLASGGGGTDTLNLNNGKPNDSADYSGFEATNVGSNTTAGDPAFGQGSTYNVTDDQSGNRITVDPGSQVNVQGDGRIDLRSDAAGGMGGGVTAFEPGATANIQTENTTGTQPTQEFSNTTFAEGTRVASSSNFVRGVASNNATTGRGEIAIQSDFTNQIEAENVSMFGAALNAITDSGLLTAEQQVTLNELISQASTPDDAKALLSDMAGEVRAHAAATGVRVATLFNSVLLPSSTRVDSRRSDISIISETSDNPLNDTTAIGNGAWISGFGGLLDAEEDDLSTGFDSNTYGIAVGYDRAVNVGESGKAVFGAGVGYGSTNVNGISDSADVTTYSLGAYFEGNSGPLAAHVAASYNSQNISGDGEDSSGGVFVAEAEGFYNLRSDAKLAVGPIGRLSGAFGSYSGFDTDSDTFKVSYDSADVSQLMAGLGVRVGGQSQVDVGLLSLNLDLLYETALSDDTVQFDGQLAGNDVSIGSPFANSNGLYIGAEAALSISERTAVGFRYQGNLGDSIQSHTGEIKFSVLF
ncbi:MAG: autotransporter domain-containing protein [Phormidesmis sp.]